MQQHCLEPVVAMGARACRQQSGLSLQLLRKGLVAEADFQFVETGLKTSEQVRLVSP
jgi:hypothetical protein